MEPAERHELMHAVLDGEANAEQAKALEREVAEYVAGPVELPELRYSAGLALAWASPLGPLRLSYASPLNEREGDRVQRLQLKFGTAF